MVQAANKVRKNFRIMQEKLDEARRILGTRTETETVEQALDLVAFRREVKDGLRELGGSNTIDDVLGEGDSGE